MKRVCSMETGTGRNGCPFPPITAHLCGCPHRAAETGGRGKNAGHSPLVRPQRIPTVFGDSGPVGSGHERLQPPQLLLYLWLGARESPS